MTKTIDEILKPVCLLCMREKQPRGGKQSWRAPKCNEACPGYEWAPTPPDGSNG